MTFRRPTLAELSRRAESELQLSDDAALRRTLFTPLARSTAALTHGLYGYLNWIADQMHPQHCSAEMLEQTHAPLWQMSRTPAAPAQGKVIITGAAGAELPQGTLLSRDDSVSFAILDGHILPTGGTLTADIVCLMPGQLGNTEPGRKLRFANPIPGIQLDVLVVAPGISQGADEEDIETLRARVMEARRNGGQVGRSRDWELWAREVPGVTRAWCAPQLTGRGAVTVFFVRDGDANIYPDSTEQARVLTHLHATGTPFGEIFAISPIPRPCPISLRVNPDTPAVRAAAINAIQRVFTRVAAPLVRTPDGQTAMPLTGVRILRSHLTEALSAVVGEEDHLLVASDIQCAIGEMAELGEVTWLT